MKLIDLYGRLEFAPIVALGAVKALFSFNKNESEGKFCFSHIHPS